MDCSVSEILKLPLFRHAERVVVFFGEPAHPIDTAVG
jgi:hypothetical protein